MAELDGVSPTKEVDFVTLENAKRRNYKMSSLRVVFNSIDYGNIYPIILKGGIKMLNIGGVRRFIGGQTIMENEPIQVPFNTEFERVYAIVRKDKKAFKSQPIYAGTYKDCQGGGWYCMVTLWKLNDKYFANF